MRHRIAVSAAIVAACSLAACDTGGPSLYNEAEIEADVAASAGEAIAASVSDMIANQSAASLPMTISGGSDESPVAFDVVVNRNRTCYDQADAVVANCTPIASVRRIVTTFTANGTRSVERTRNGVTTTFTGTVNRTASDTIRRTFNGSTETSRSHAGVGSGDNSTTFTESDFTRVVDETVKDTVKALVFNLPRSSNPWPVSGSIVRASEIEVTLTKGDLSESRSLSRKVTVTFPADAQGNVVLTVDDLTCNLNLVTRRVTNCT